MAKVKKLILPIAGLGKRLRPLTLKIPKNLIKVNGKPILEYTLEEAVSAGLEEVIFIVSPEHLKVFRAYLAIARKKFPRLTFHIRAQEKPFGNGHAILQAADLLTEPFVVRFPDDIILGKQSIIGELVHAHEKTKGAVMLLRRVAKREVVRYGVVKTSGVRKRLDDGWLYRIRGFAEKPAIHLAPSNLIIIGGYVLLPKIIKTLRALERTMPQVDDGLHLVHAFESEVASAPYFGYEFKGVRLDCGTLDGLKHAEEYFRKEEVAVAHKFMK